MSTTSEDVIFDEEAFEWNKYLMIRDAEEVPDDFFFHVCKSEQNGIDLGSFVEIENEDRSGYWFASVCSSNGVLLNLHYFGDDNDKHDFWLEVKSSRIHSLNWGSENNKKLIPPYPDTFFRVNPDIIKENVQDCEHVVSNAVLKMGGAPIYNIFKPGMLVEVQDREYPYRVWVSKILKNVGGRLFLSMEGASSPEKKPFWLFYMNDRIFPFGWAEQKGLPWRVMNLNINLEDINDSSSLLNVLKPKTPGQHTYKVGEMLEVVNPYSLMVFYVGTIVKIYDNRYFKVELDNDKDIHKRITFVATKENPYLFEPGWASKHKFILKPPSDWETQTSNFCWSEYASMKNSKLAIVDNVCRKKLDKVHIGMKLEAVDPIKPSCIRVATVKGFADHWMFLSFDRTSWCQGLLHVRSIYSDDIFPAGWCNKHKYLLSAPKIPFSDCQDYDYCYYVSDVEIDFDAFSDESMLEHPSYFKGDIPYYFSQKSLRSFEGISEESVENVLNDNYVENSNDIKVDNVKTELPELDEEFHDALFLEGEVNAKNFDSVENEDGLVTVQKETDDEIEKEKTLLINSLYTDNNHNISIYFNKSCRPGPHIVRKKISELPDSIGPGPVLDILQKAITLLVNSNYFPVTSLKKIGRNQNILLDGPGGVPMLIYANVAKSRSTYSEYITLPESMKMAHVYCSALCKFYGMCEYFMTTEKMRCSRDCNVKENTYSKLKSKVEVSKSKITNRRKHNNDDNNLYETHSKVNNQIAKVDSKLKSEVEVGKSITTNKRKHDTDDDDNIYETNSTISNKIAKIAKDHLDWTNLPLVGRYKYYLACVMQYELYIKELNQCPSPEAIILKENMHLKKHCLRIMDGIDDYQNTRSELRNLINKMIDKNEKLFVFKIDWKNSMENYYRNDPRFKSTGIDIGHFETIEVTSNPKYWSPDDVFKYLSNDQCCSEVAKTMVKEEVDGIAFMILTEDQILNHLKCPLNLAVRIMCHVAEAKFVCFTEYIDS